uniref:Uncharacterized protein n=1 Tax=Anguilla anguilla TaxID=7936 RepID=A0A0E9VJD2_ANGAN
MFNESRKNEGLISLNIVLQDHFTSLARQGVEGINGHNTARNKETPQESFHITFKFPHL